MDPGPTTPLTRTALDAPGRVVRPPSELRIARGSGGEAGQPPAWRKPSSSGLVDGQQRLVRYLRFSVVDRCNLRCRYCMPAEGVPFAPRADLLTPDEMVRLTRIFVALGVESVRLTGGEPLLRRDIVELSRRIAAVPGIRDLAISTNATHLAPIAAELRAAGVHRLNISLDSLDPAVFADITRMDVLPRVLDGIEAARAAGFAPLKLNVVVLRGRNDTALVDLVRYAAPRGLVLRFIEYMPIGIDGYWSEDTWVPVDAMLARLREHLDVSELGGFAADGGLAGGGPARYADVCERDGTPLGRVGFIAALSRNFCSTCNRVRVTATGTLQECLAFPGTRSLRDMLRGGASDADIGEAIRTALAAKGPGHLFESGQFTYQSMSVTGG
jgi:cyclic pyranopterin phosphate synthase